MVQVGSKCQNVLSPGKSQILVAGEAVVNCSVLHLKLVGGQLGIFREKKKKSHELDPEATAFRT